MDYFNILGKIRPNYYQLLLSYQLHIYSFYPFLHGLWNLGGDGCRVQQHGGAQAGLGRHVHHIGVLLRDQLHHADFLHAGQVNFYSLR